MAKRMNMEDTAFVLADAVLGYYSEHGRCLGLLTEEKFEAVLDDLQKANPERFQKEIAPFI